MSQLLEEAKKMYEEIGEINSDIQILKKTKKEKINCAKNKMIEFVEAQIIPVAKELGYDVHGIKCSSGRIVSWKKYKEIYRGWLITLNRQEPLRLYLNDSKNREFIIDINIFLRYGPEVQIAHMIGSRSEELHKLDLDSLENSLKEYIKKYERELFG